MSQFFTWGGQSTGVSALCFTFWFFGCEAYGILVPWLGIKPSPPVLKVRSLNHWIPREVPCHVYFWTSHSPQHRAWHTAVVQEKSRKPFTLCAMTFLSPKRWIVSQHFLNWNIIDLQYCVNFCYTANISQRNFNFLRNDPQREKNIKDRLYFCTTRYSGD